MLSVLKKGEPLADDLKLARLRQFLLDIMDAQGEGTVNFKRVCPRSGTQQPAVLFQICYRDQKPKQGMQEVLPLLAMHCMFHW